MISKIIIFSLEDSLLMIPGLVSITGLAKVDENLKVFPNASEASCLKIVDNKQNLVLQSKSLIETFNFWYYFNYYLTKSRVCYNA